MLWVNGERDFPINGKDLDVPLRQAKGRLAEVQRVGLPKLHRGLTVRG
jgi:hypothetical protein